MGKVTRIQVQAEWVGTLRQYETKRTWALEIVQANDTKEEDEIGFRCVLLLFHSFPFFNKISKADQDVYCIVE